MTHLSPQEFTDALDGALAVARQVHLDGCAACRAELAALVSTVDDLGAGAPVPEPSPLFWRHFGARVREAAAADAAPGWWTRAWRPVLVVAAPVAAVLVALSIGGARPTAPDAPGVAAVSAPVGGEAAAGIDLVETLAAAETMRPWDLMVGVTAGLSFDDVHQVAVPMPGSAVLVIEDLTDAERQELVRLLRAELGGL